MHGKQNVKKIIHIVDKAAFRRTLYFVSSLVDWKGTGLATNSDLQKRKSFY